MRVYLRKPLHPWAPIWLIVGTRQIIVCNEFAEWFRRKFGEEAALRDVWEAMTCPAWMLWVTTRFYMPRCLQELGSLHVWLTRTEAVFIYGSKRDLALARKLRLVMPGELLEALLAEEEP